MMVSDVDESDSPSPACSYEPGGGAMMLRWLIKWLRELRRRPECPQADGWKIDVESEIAAELWLADADYAARVELLASGAAESRYSFRTRRQTYSGGVDGSGL